MAPDQKEPVSIPADVLEDAFTVSSMRVCSKFAEALLEEVQTLGERFVAPSQRLFVAYFNAQINEADAHGAGRCVWVIQMTRAVDRIETDLEAGTTLQTWDGQLRAFVAQIRQSLSRVGLGGQQDLPLTELGRRPEPDPEPETT